MQYLIVRNQNYISGQTLSRSHLGIGVQMGKKTPLSWHIEIFFQIGLKAGERTDIIEITTRDWNETSERTPFRSQLKTGKKDGRTDTSEIATGDWNEEE